VAREEDFSFKGDERIMDHLVELHTPLLLGGEAGRIPRIRHPNHATALAGSCTLK
jgi:hypothetical protein